MASKVNDLAADDNERTLRRGHISAEKRLMVDPDRVNPGRVERFHDHVLTRETVEKALSLVNFQCKQAALFTKEEKGK